VLIFLFQYKVHILRLIVEHNIRQMSPTTLLSRGERQCTHFKSCALVGTPLTSTTITVRNMYVRISLGTANISASSQETGLPGCFAVQTSNFVVATFLI